MSQMMLDISVSSLPLFMTRKDISIFFGSLYSVNYLAKLDSKKQGPPKQRIGKKIVYKREEFVRWLETRLNR
jgi:hypothetical protein